MLCDIAELKPTLLLDRRARRLSTSVQIFFFDVFDFFFCVFCLQPKSGVGEIFDSVIKLRDAWQAKISHPKKRTELTSNAYTVARGMHIWQKFAGHPQTGL